MASPSLENKPRNPPPRFATPRSNRETLGAEVAAVLARSGPRNPQRPGQELLPVMPWQRDALDLICEIDPATGLFWYRTFIMVCLRQTGKTTMIRGKINHRALIQRNARILYTAQDRNKGRQRLEETIYNPLRASLLGSKLLKPRWAAGSEAVRWRNGSTLRTESLSPTSGHGDTLDEGHLDEAFAHRDARVEQNVKPTMSTVEGAQMGIWSAAGDTNSAYLWRKVERGRALALAGTTSSRTCYLEFSAPEDADPYDPETLLNCHPGIGYSTTMDILWEERMGGMEEDEFNRAYYGWWPKVDAAKYPLPWDAWQENFVGEDQETWQGVPMWTVDISPDREWASIAWAARSCDPSARCFVEVLYHEQGTSWIVPRLRQLVQKFGGWQVAIDGNGAATTLLQDLEDIGMEVLKLDAGERAAACGAIYDDVVQNKIHYFDDPELNDAMKAAVWIPAYSGNTRIFSRGKSLKDISPLYAATFARFAYVKYAPADDLMQTIG